MKVTTKLDEPHTGSINGPVRTIVPISDFVRAVMFLMWVSGSFARAARVRAGGGGVFSQ